MTISGIIFYVLAVIILAATALAITRRNVMHAIVYLVVSFFGMAPAVLSPGGAASWPCWRSSFMPGPSWCCFCSSS